MTLVHNPGRKGNICLGDSSGSPWVCLCLPCKVKKFDSNHLFLTATETLNPSATLSKNWNNDDDDEYCLMLKLILPPCVMLDSAHLEWLTELEHDAKNFKT